MKAFFLRVVPKKGPLSALAFHPPTPEVEGMYMQSFNQALDDYRALLCAEQHGRLQLPNDNLDTGTLIGAAVYQLTDETYAKLLNETAGKPISNPLRLNLLDYYSDLNKPFATKRSSKEWHELLRELDTLRSSTTNQSCNGGPTDC